MSRTRGTGARLWPVAEDKYAALERRRRRAQIAARHALDRGPVLPEDVEPCRPSLTPCQGSLWESQRPVAS